MEPQSSVGYLKNISMIFLFTIHIQPNHGETWWTFYAQLLQETDSHF